MGNLFQTATQKDRRYGPAGQLLRAQGTRYKYDESGNLIRKETATGHVWRYQWTGAGQLSRVTRPDGYAVTFSYDALGRRISKRFRGKVTRWVWDGNKPLHEWSELAVGPGAGGVEDLATWLFEEDSFAPLAKLTQAGAYSVVTDQVGTPLELYDQAGTKTWQAQLDSYGGVRAGRGQPQDCPFRYQGQYEDQETGLYYNRFRYYDPEVGQYISQDPIGLEGGMAAYAYVPDPTSWVDPFGLSKKSGCGTVSSPFHTPYRKGYDKASVAAMPKGTRPDPKKYLKKQYVDRHLEQFHGEASYLVTGQVYEDRIMRATEIGRPDGQFISTKTDIDAVLSRANGDVAIIEQELGIPEGWWQDQKGIYRVDIKNPEDLNLRLPSGNEGGANDLWEPGGLVPGGSPEAVVDQIPTGMFKATEVIPR